jgi:hypothetical protein
MYPLLLHLLLPAMMLYVARAVADDDGDSGEGV